METSSEKGASRAVDLGKYAVRILTDEDRPLFDEAVEAANVGALRAAYVMIWLACAESLKRRFYEARTRDNTAGPIVGAIQTMEQHHKAIDKFLLEEAHKYGFLSDSGRLVLNQIYEMRCIYGHPYEEAPSHEKVVDAAHSVVELVLSKPVKLRHGYGNQLLKSLLNDRTYLDDQESAVTVFTKGILLKLDETIHTWLLDKYWKELEKIADDSSMAIFFRRGMWFCRTMLAEAGVDILTNEEWHEKSSQFPKTLMTICSIVEIFSDIGEQAQDSLVGLILNESGTRASVLTYLERLNDKDALSRRQSERFLNGISEMPISAIRTSGLSTKTCYLRLIRAMKSHDFYTQNPAVLMIVSNGPDQATELTEHQQIDMGRNILQAAQGRARDAEEFLQQLSQNVTYWPFGVVQGIALESFTNENGEIRIKELHLPLIFDAIEHLSGTRRSELITCIVTSIDVGTPKFWRYPQEYSQIIGLLNAYSWAEPLREVLMAKLPAEEEISSKNFSPDELT